MVFRFILLCLASSAMLACGDAEEPMKPLTDDLERGRRYLDDVTYRRQVLEDSIIIEDNGYSTLRLANYATGREGAWDDLPIWNPETRYMVEDDLMRYRGDIFRASTEDEPELSALPEMPESFTEEGLIALGREVFQRYPLTLEGAVDQVFATENPDDYGFWRGPDERVGGFVRVRTPDGSERSGFTCASCHARVIDGELALGAANGDLDYAALFALIAGGISPHTWPRGTVDVTSDGIDNPAAIIDLRPIQHQARLHWAATLRNDLIALAVRVETLLITSLRRSQRPPRIYALALAFYLYSLGDEGEVGDESHEGAELFAQRCSGCHHADGSTGPPVPLVQIGTDFAVGQGSRATGAYRVPSLWGVATRSPLMHHAAVDSLEEMFEPMRIETVAGHPFGLELTPDERASLLGFVRTIGAVSEPSP